jgi:hypothetical protein
MKAKYKSLSKKKIARRAQGYNHSKIGARIKEKGSIKKGYLYEYKAKIDSTDISLAKLGQYKLIPYLNIYSNRKNNQFNIDGILRKLRRLSPLKELENPEYKLLKITEIINSALITVRKSCWWKVEKRDIPIVVDDKNITVYTGFTTLYYLKHLLDKRFVTKSETIIKTSRRLINKYAPGNHSFEHDPEKQKLVCITDGETVWRVKKYKADKITSERPSIMFCSKWAYQVFLDNLYHPKDQTQPILFTKGGKEGCRNPGTGTRRERRQILQKHKPYSQNYREQIITGKWVSSEDILEENLLKFKYDDRFKERLRLREKRRWNGWEKYEIFVEDGYKKKIHHYISPKEHVKAYYNPLKRKQAKPSMFEKIETVTRGIHISKFPYNKPITVNYTVKDKDGTEHKNTIKQNVKMVNKHIVYDDPELKEQVVVCPVSDVDKWCYQEDFREIGSKEGTRWIPLITVEPITKTKVIIHYDKLPQRKQKIKKWRHPIKGVKAI